MIRSKFREVVRCIDCGLYNDTAKPNVCRKSGARITKAQSVADIYCDFFVDKNAYNPVNAGWRGVDSIPIKSNPSPSKKPSRKMGITKAEAKAEFKRKQEKQIIARFGRTPYGLQMVDDYWDMYVIDLYKSKQIPKEKAEKWIVGMTRW